MNLVPFVLCVTFSLFFYFCSQFTCIDSLWFIHGSDIGRIAPGRKTSPAPLSPPLTAVAPFSNFMIPFWPNGRANTARCRRLWRKGTNGHFLKFFVSQFSYIIFESVLVSSFSDFNIKGQTCPYQ